MIHSVNVFLNLYLDLYQIESSLLGYWNVIEQVNNFPSLILRFP